MIEEDRIAEKTDEELARDARAGSRRSFEELARRYKRRLFVYLRPRVASDEDAEDMVQDTFLKLFRNMGGYDPAYKFSAWLYTSAGRLAIDSYRKNKAGRNTVAISADMPIADPAAGRDPGPGESGLWDAARALGGDRFRVLWLRYGEDLTIEEIAAVVGRTKLAVRVLLHRARTSLAGLVGPEMGRAVGARPGAASHAAGN